MSRTDHHRKSGYDKQVRAYERDLKDRLERRKPSAGDEIAAQLLPDEPANAYAYDGLKKVGRGYMRRNFPHLRPADLRAAEVDVQVEKMADWEIELLGFAAGTVFVTETPHPSKRLAWGERGQIAGHLLDGSCCDVEQDLDDDDDILIDDFGMPSAEEDEYEFEVVDFAPEPEIELLDLSDPSIRVFRDVAYTKDPNRAYDKVRVYELARMVGLSCPATRSLLLRQGEFTKSPSSTVPMIVAERITALAVA